MFPDSGKRKLPAFFGGDPVLRIAANVADRCLTEAFFSAGSAAARRAGSGGRFEAAGSGRDSVCPDKPR